VKNRKKTMALQFVKPASKTTEQEYDVFPIERVASLVTESIFVIDIGQRCFRFVGGHDLFLGGYSSDEIKQSGYDFFRRIIHPDDKCDD
jgi:hypothetical protein